MKTCFTAIVVLALSLTTLAFNPENRGKKNFHSFTVKTITGEEFDLARLKGKKVLVVNTASRCGLTPQYEELQKLYGKLDRSRFEIIAFPANNFLMQEPGSNEEIYTFCKKNYKVTFPIMAKVSVCDHIYQSYPIDPEKAEKTTTDEIYQWLTRKSLNNVKDTTVQWNFHKFLIDEKGNLVGDLSPGVAREILLLKEWFAD